MRRLSAALAATVALGVPMLSASPASAVEINTCIVIVGVTVTTSPPGVRIDRIVVKSVSDCV